MKALSAMAAAVLLACSAAYAPVMAQEKKVEKKAEKKAEKGRPVIKEIAQNDKLRVFEAHFRPGDAGNNVERPLRVTRALQGGTIERTYPDGKKERVTWKTGEVKIQGPDAPFVPKNVGKSDIRFYIVQLK